MWGRAPVVSALTTALATFLLPAASSALAAFPGANGKIAFEHIPGVVGGNSDVFTIEPNGQNRTPLTDGPEDDGQPAWSPDGEQIAFQRNPAGPVLGQIWVMRFDGTGQTQLTGDPMFDDRNPAFFPDGTRIVFQRMLPGSAGNQLFVMDANGSNVAQLTFPGSNGEESFEPAVSPDGQRIVFRRNNDFPGTFDEIWVMNADGSGQTPLTTGTSSFRSFEPDWSPDGQRIAFTVDDGTQDDIYVMNANGSGQRPVTTGPDFDLFPAWAPDGLLVAFERAPASFAMANIFVADPGGTNQGVAPVTDVAAPTEEVDPTWQPLNPPDCTLSGKPTQKAFKQVSVTVTCSNENAAVVAQGSGKAPKVPKSGAVISKAKKFTIPAVTAQAPQGAPTTVTLTIPKKGKKALKKAAKAGKKGKATITATLTDDLGQSSNSSFNVKFKAKKK